MQKVRKWRWFLTDVGCFEMKNVASPMFVKYAGKKRFWYNKLNTLFKNRY